jgi:hypothetical protein
MFVVLLPTSWAVSFREGITTHQLSYYELRATQLCPQIIFNQVLTDTVLMKTVTIKCNIKILNRGFLDIATYKYEQMALQYFAIENQYGEIWIWMRKYEIYLPISLFRKKNWKFDHNKPRVLFYLEKFCERFKFNTS